MRPVIWAKVDSNGFWINGRRLYCSGGVNDFSEQQLEDYYRALEINYPKFYKMDGLSRLALVCAEPLLKGSKDNGEMAILFASQLSSLSTDLKHYVSIDEKTGYFPSPSTFVYTLPNIAVGEVAIRHRIRGESVFWAADGPPVEKWVQYMNALFEEGVENVLLGWVESASLELKERLQIEGLETKAVTALVYKDQRNDLEKNLRAIFLE